MPPDAAPEPQPVDWLLAGPLFRMGYHAWLYEQCVRAADAVAGRHVAEEGRLFQDAVKEALRNTATDSLMLQPLQSVRDMLQNTADVNEFGQQFRSGRLCGLPKIVERALRPAWEPGLRAWFWSGLECVACEMGMSIDLRRHLKAGGMPEKELVFVPTQMKKVEFGALREPIEKWLADKAKGVGRREVWLQELRRQHAAGGFPDKQLLRDLDISKQGIEYLRLLHRLGGRPITDTEAVRLLSSEGTGLALSVDRTRIVQIRNEIHPKVREILLRSHGRIGHGWRQSTDLSDV